MFNKKPKKLTNLSREDLAELNKRNELVDEHVLIIQALDLLKRFWLNDKLQKLGLDLSKQYEVSSVDGAITEKENEPAKDKGTT